MKMWKKVRNIRHIIGCDSDVGGCSNVVVGDDEDWDDGDVHNGGIHNMTLWLFCPAVIHANELFSHAYVSAVCNT